MQKKFNIRAYGILINNQHEVLLSDERRGGMFFTKFPGGGLEWGEGIIDCLKREFQEELSIAIEARELFYCTESFLASTWNVNDQLISIYYMVHYSEVNTLTFDYYPIPFEEEEERFRWVSLEAITSHLFTFPIDKIVGQKLHDTFSSKAILTIHKKKY